jgi:hypothetical protein
MSCAYVLRLGDVDLIQNCNANSTIAQADNLLKRVVRHGGVLMRHDELPSRVAALRGGVRGLPPKRGVLIVAQGTTATGRLVVFADAHKLDPPLRAALLPLLAPLDDFAVFI